MTGYAYLFRDGAGRVGGFGGDAERATAGGDDDGSSAGAHLKNSLVFTLGFLETVVWYWVRFCRVIIMSFALQSIQPWASIEEANLSDCRHS